MKGRDLIPSLETLTGVRKRFLQGNYQSSKKVGKDSSKRARDA